MVNKQYNVQPTIGPKHYTPPPSNSKIPVIQTNENVCAINSENSNDFDIITEEMQQQPHKHNGQFRDRGKVYCRNIVYYNESSDDNRVVGENKSGDGIINLQQNSSSGSAEESNTNLTINDIGRFQYILQMDREMGSHSANDQMYQVSPSTESPASQQTPSHSNSLTSFGDVKFWKAGSQSQNTNRNYNHFYNNYYESKGNKFIKFLKLLFKYLKWPLGLLLICGLLGIVVYILVLGMQPSSITESSEYVDDNLSIDFNDNLLSNNLQNSFKPNEKIINGHAAHFPKRTEEIVDLFKPLLNEKEEDLNNLLAVYINKPFSPSSPTTLRPSEAPKASNNLFFDSVASSNVEKVTTESSIIKKINVSELGGSKIIKTSTTPTDTSSTAVYRQKLLPVTNVSPTIQSFSFTSGHQNNFGVPVEEDERILKLLSEHNKKYNTSINFYTTTNRNIFNTKVSPTLPIVQKFEYTTESIRKNLTDDGVCESTSLQICTGILHYDLTTSSNRKLITNNDYQHFLHLIESQCSQRAAEFVCAILEPECRPMRMGSLQPCKRICKAILEPCAHIIASSEILTSTFDCDGYPDSNNRSVCNDPTMFTKCNDNEFNCLDSSCIPQQWKCDNIKDCKNGEDEENCVFCEQNQFRCSSNKCISEKFRCDFYDDCGDLSDEKDCSDEFEEDPFSSFINARVFPFAQEQDQLKNLPYLTISNEDRLVQSDSKNDEDRSSDGDKIISTSADHIPVIERGGKDEDEIQSEAASGRAFVLPKNLNNFQDSKEIMITSDSENDYKYSSTPRRFRSTTPNSRTRGNSKISTATTRETTLYTTVPSTTHPVSTSHSSPCPEEELRCVSGRCITLDQLCDKIVDCSDGSDESHCEYVN